MSYSNSTVSATYRFAAATLSTAAIIGRIIGPAGMEGQLIDVSTVITTGVTTTANTLDVGTTGDVASAGTLTTAISAADAVDNGAVVVEGAVCIFIITVFVF